MHHAINFDGAISKNPGGIASYGVVLRSTGGRTLERRGLSGRGEGCTVNTAEYHGLLASLELACRLQTRLPEGSHTFTIRGDSQFVVSTANGTQGLKASHLIPLRDEAQSLLSDLDAELTWIPRGDNAHADRLAGKALREAFDSLPLAERRDFIWHVESEFNGTCKQCSRAIHEGESVTKTGIGWVHLRCAYRQPKTAPPSVELGGPERLH